MRASSSAGSASGTSWNTPAAALGLGLDRLPPLAHAPGGARLGVAEDVRVAADELLVDGARHRVEIALALLLEEERQEEDLEQQVAELVVELRRVVGEGRVGDLVCLLDGVRDDRARGLLAIPRALGAEAPGQLPELRERPVGAHAADATRRRSVSSPVVVVSGGSKPAAYVTLSSYFFWVSATQSFTALFLFSEWSWVRIWSLTWANGVTDPGLTSASGWIRWKPNSVLIGAESSLVFSEKAALSKGATVCPRVTVSLPPWSFEPGSSDDFFASAAKFAPPASCECSCVGLRLRLDEDVPNGARLGDGVGLLVRVVVLLDVGVGDLDAVRHLVVDPLRDELRADVLAQRRLGVALLLQALLELLLVVREVLLLDLVDLLGDLRVGDLDPELLALARVLLALDEEGDRLGLERLVLGRPRLGERALLRGVGLLRARQELGRATRA